MMFKKCAKFHWCILRGFNFIKTVYELFDNPSYFVADRFRVLSSFQLLMKFYSFDYILHGFLDHYVDLTDWGIVCLSEMPAKQNYSLKTQDNHNIFCPFHNQLVEISDLQITDCRLQMHQCICIDFSFHHLEILFATLNHL